MKRPSRKQAGAGLGVLLLVVLVVWMMSKSSSASSSTSTAGRQWSRPYDSQGAPFADAASDGQPTVGIYGVDWF